MPELKDSATLAWSESGGDLEGTVQGDVSVDSVTVANGGTVGSTTTPGAITVASNGNLEIVRGLSMPNMNNANAFSMKDDTTTNGMVFQTNAAGDAWKMVPIESGSANFGREITYSHTNQAWSIEGDFTLSNGDLIFGNSGKGIDFSATSDASGSTSELLDDYEEGTWTPTTASDATGTLSTAQGAYTKIGNVVTVVGLLSVSGNFTSDAIGGLPFAVSDPTLATSYPGFVGRVMTNSTDDILVHPVANNTTLRFANDGATAAISAHTPNTTNATYRFSITYTV